MTKRSSKNYRIILYMLLIFAFVQILTMTIFSFLQRATKKPLSQPVANRSWEIRSIDTMKYSRDRARLKLNYESFYAVIDKQMANITGTGANYVAIGTPYDEEFRPMLARWVAAARKYKLRVWFRGNFSGWEGWFNYPKIDRLNHIAKTKQFITDNQDLFADGDIFTSCPECEHGARVELSNPQSLEEHKAFLITEQEVAKEGFAQIGKKVETGYYSMNGDLASVLMDRETTSALGGVVVIDHYVETPEKLAQDIRELAKKSGGKVILGEFGAPIPDIHGKMTEEEQNAWIHLALTEIAAIPELIGVNYWVNIDGTTALWNNDGSERAAVKTVRDFYLFFKRF